MNSPIFTDNTLRDALNKKGISQEQFTQQILLFTQGAPKIQLESHADIDRGIHKIDEDEIDEYIGYFRKKQNDLVITKFTPASGLATRMFKSLMQFYNTRINNPESRIFFDNLHKFPFFNKVIETFKKAHPEVKNLDDLKNRMIFLDFLLTPNGLNYKNTPKGLVKFHQYNFSNKSALEEQIDESVYYAIGKEDTINLHFTVRPDYLEEFKQKTEKYINHNYDDKEYTFKTSYSIQESNTETIAVNLDNTPYKQQDGSYLFRAGGHGALLNNLDKIDADLIFIKNIDNVSHQSHSGIAIRYKKLLAGKLLAVQKKVFKTLSQIKEDKPVDYQELLNFIKKEFHINLTDLSQEELYQFLNRPIRVCGMIKNQGDPGGGPFWVEDDKGNSSLQIVETAQINTQNLEQASILNQASHFNPVDLVCSTKNFEGNKFDLHQFKNPNTVFITEKTDNGRPIKALEHPGLWNGAMADWLTIFVEVPYETFNPVKSVVDLLSHMHQG